MEVEVAAADIEDAAGRRQRAVRHVGEEVALALEVHLLDRIVGDVAEILRAVVVADISDVRRDAGRVGRLEVIAVLVPAPGDGLSAERGDIGDVLLHVGEVEARIAVLAREPVDPAARHRQRERSEGEVRGDVRMMVSISSSAGRARIIPLCGCARTARERTVGVLTPMSSIWCGRWPDRCRTWGSRPLSIGPGRRRPRGIRGRERGWPLCATFTASPSTERANAPSAARRRWTRRPRPSPSVPRPFAA